MVKEWQVHMVANQGCVANQGVLDPADVTPRDVWRSTADVLEPVMAPVEAQSLAGALASTQAAKRAERLSATEGAPMRLKRLIIVPAAAGVLVLVGMSAASAGEITGNGKPAQG